VRSFWIALLCAAASAASLFSFSLAVALYGRHPVEACAHLALYGINGFLAYCNARLWVARLGVRRA